MLKNSKIRTFIEKQYFKFLNVKCMTFKMHVFTSNSLIYILTTQIIIFYKLKKIRYTLMN